MKPYTTNKIQEELIQAQLRQFNSLTKKTLWDTEFISQDEAAFLLGISKETLRDRALVYKPLRKGNKFYYSTAQLKNALIQEGSQKVYSRMDIANEFENLTKTKRNERENQKNKK